MRATKLLHRALPTCLQICPKKSATANCGYEGRCFSRLLQRHVKRCGVPTGGRLIAPLRAKLPR